MAEEIWRALVRYADQAMLVTDELGSIFYENEAAAALRPAETDGLAGRNFLTEVYPEDRDRVREAFAAANTSSPATSGQWSCRWRERDGQWLPVDCRIRVVDTGDGRRTLIHVRDLSERTHWELLLRHANKVNVLGKLTAGIVDELDQIVATMRHHLPALVGMGSELVQLNVRALARATNRASSMVRQLQLFRDVTPVASQPCDIHALLHVLRRSLAGETWLQLSLDAPLHTVRTDRSLLTLGLQEVVLGLHDALADSGLIRVSTRVSSDRRRSTAAWDPGKRYLVVGVTYAQTDQWDESELYPFERHAATAFPGSIGMALITLDEIASAAGGFVEVATSVHQVTGIELCFPLD